MKVQVSTVGMDFKVNRGIKNQCSAKDLHWTLLKLFTNSSKMWNTGFMFP